MKKPWYRSKMLWLNACAAGLAAFEAGTGLLQPHLPVNFYVALAVGLPVANAVLRVITTQGVSLRNSSASPPPREGG